MRLRLALFARLRAVVCDLCFAFCSSFLGLHQWFLSAIIRPHQEDVAFRSRNYSVRVRPL